jgi:NADH-quinone oxidoreductase subunit G
MATIYIDNQPYNANPKQNLLHTCLSHGFDLPYFCWHPALGSVGACRQCAVKQFRDEHDTQGKLVMACMTPAQDGTRIAIHDAEAQAFRASVIEWLMTNHPHDCPVCDEGGECHLQDMTVMTGHTYRHHRFAKRTFRNQDLGPFINHEMNRCIQCYRCVRFYRNYAGGRDLEAFAAHNHVYFGRHEDGVLESEFSGNLVEVCPTGVFTDKTLKRHYSRKWDLQTAPSVCAHCGLGCNTIPGERYGQLRRIRNRYNGQVNGYFLCDRGRFGYEFVNAEQRIRQPLVRRSGTVAAVTSEAALEQVASRLETGRQVIGIGSPRAGLEANFALRTLVGPERFYTGMSATEGHLLALIGDILRHGPARTPCLRDVEQADTVLVLGEDVPNVAPRLALALRQSVRQQPMHLADELGIPRWHDAAVREALQQETGPLYLATPACTRLDDVATSTFRAAPDDIARMGFAVAHAVHADAPAVAELPEETAVIAAEIAEALSTAQRPLVIAGPSLGSEAIVQAAANVAWALCRREKSAGLCYTVPECDSLGVELLGGKRLPEACRAVQDGEVDTVVILENDLYRRADATTVHALLDTCQSVIVLDHTTHATTEHAEVVLPVGTFAEADGTLVSSEGRAQRFYQVFVPEGDTQESWRWLRDIMLALGREEVRAWQDLDDVVEALCAACPVFVGLQTLAPAADFRLAGRKVPRQPHRSSGRTAMTASRDVHEPAPPADPDTPLAFSMEGSTRQPPSALIPFFWAPAWNSVQATNTFQSEVGGPLRGGDPGLRLLEPALERTVPYFEPVPPAFVPRPGSWLVVPLYDIFGTEELSRLAPAVAARAPAPCLALHREDAATLGMAPGDTVTLTLYGRTYQLPVTIETGVPKGIAGLVVGLPGFQGLELPVWSTVTKEA